MGRSHDRSRDRQKSGHVDEDLLADEDKTESLTSRLIFWNVDGPTSNLVINDIGHHENAINFYLLKNWIEIPAVKNEDRKSKNWTQIPNFNSNI